MEVIELPNGAEDYFSIDSSAVPPFPQCIQLVSNGPPNSQSQQLQPPQFIFSNESANVPLVQFIPGNDSGRSGFIVGQNPASSNFQVMNILSSNLLTQTTPTVGNPGSLPVLNGGYLVGQQEVGDVVPVSINGAISLVAAQNSPYFTVLDTDFDEDEPEIPPHFLDHTYAKKPREPGVEPSRKRKKKASKARQPITIAPEPPKVISSLSTTQVQLSEVNPAGVSGTKVNIIRKAISPRIIRVPTTRSQIFRALKPISSKPPRPSSPPAPTRIFTGSPEHVILADANNTTKRAASSDTSLNKTEQDPATIIVEQSDGTIKPETKNNESAPAVEETGYAVTSDMASLEDQDIEMGQPVCFSYD